MAGNWNIQAIALITFGYAVYLLQAGILHGYNYMHEEGRPLSYLVRASFLTIFYVILMLVFTVLVLNENHISPF